MNPVIKNMSKKYNSKNRLILFALSFVWLFILFYFSGQTGAVSNRLSRSIAQILLRVLQNPFFEVPLDLGMINNALRDIAHFLVYFVLAIIMFVIYKQFKATKHYAAVLTIGTGMLIGISDELYQMFIPGRTSEWLDVLINILGICTAVAFMNDKEKKCGKVKNK